MHTGERMVRREEENSNFSSRVDESISRCRAHFRAVSSGKQNYKSIFHVINRIFKLTFNLDTKSRLWREMKWIEMGKSLISLVDAESRLSRGRDRWCFMGTLRAVQNGLWIRKASRVRLSAQSIQLETHFDRARSSRQSPWKKNFLFKIWGCCQWCHVLVSRTSTRCHRVSILYRQFWTKSI